MKTDILIKILLATFLLTLTLVTLKNKPEFKLSNLEITKGRALFTANDYKELCVTTANVTLGYAEKFVRTFKYSRPVHCELY
jgi:hypothetical protein